MKTVGLFLGLLCIWAPTTINAETNSQTEDMRSQRALFYKGVLKEAVGFAIAASSLVIVNRSQSATGVMVAYGLAALGGGLFLDGRDDCRAAVFLANKRKKESLWFQKK